MSISNTAVQNVQFDPRNALFRADPYPTYRQLREQNPIYFRSTHNDWLITRHRDINQLFKDNRIGHFNADSPLAAPSQWHHLPVEARHLAAQQTETQRLSTFWINLKSPPVHTRLRKQFHHAFTLSQTAKLAPRIQSLADQLIDQATNAGKFDVVCDYALPLSSTIISEILAIPETDRARLLPWAHRVASALDIDVDPMTNRRSQLALMGLFQYFRTLITERQHERQPQADFIELLLQAQADGLLSADELLANYTLLLITGYLTTTHAIGNGIFALLRHPAQLERLQAEPDLIETAVGECIRYDSPAQIMSRTVLTDVEYEGNLLRKGQGVQLLLGAGNRDPAQFPDPECFDIGRTPNHYLSFGRGMHHCIGARLALLITKIGIDRLIRRRPRIALSDHALEWEESYLIHGLKTLPVLV